MKDAASWHRIWSRRGPVACLLWPLSWVYGLLWQLRRTLYAMGWLKVQRLPVPVLVVGNVMVGGVGKTPITIELARQLKRMGWRPGLVSRGYGRSSEAVLMVTADSQAKEVGDEPLLLHRATQLPVAVGAKRAMAGQHLLTQHPEVNLLIADDGLQHLALHHDLAMCVFDERGLGNGWLLPAGPLREPWPGRHDNRTAHCWTLSSEPVSQANAWQIQRNLSSVAINGHGQTAEVQSLPGPHHALAGIAQPQRFFKELQALGVTLTRTVIMPDHALLQDWRPDAQGTWFCTEKDAVKIWPHHPEVWAVPLNVKLPPALIERIDQSLRSPI
jgi:tetraacyldisaccharide 4'-kinase